MERVKREIHNTVKERIKPLITKAGNVSAFARSIDVSRDAVNNWLFDKSDFRLNDLVKISQNYGVSVDYLLGFAESPTREGTQQAAEEYTGLSPNAVDVLRKNLNGYIDYVSAIIESPYFNEYIYQLESLENRIYSCQQEIGIIQENGIYDGFPITFEMMNDPDFMDSFNKREKGSFAVSRLYTELALLQVTLFKLSRIHSSIIESAFPNEKTISEGQEILKRCDIDF